MQADNEKPGLAAFCDLKTTDKIPLKMKNDAHNGKKQSQLFCRGNRLGTDHCSREHNSGLYSFPDNITLDPLYIQKQPNARNLKRNLDRTQTNIICLYPQWPHVSNSQCYFISSAPKGPRKIWKKVRERISKIINPEQLHFKKWPHKQRKDWEWVWQNSSKQSHALWFGKPTM